MKSLVIALLLITTVLYAQNHQTLKGLILDDQKQTPLPYTNIIVLHQNLGTISNESGVFSLNIDTLEKSDTISFQYIGYKTLKLTLA